MNEHITIALSRDEALSLLAGVCADESMPDDVRIKACGIIVELATTKTETA